MKLNENQMAEIKALHAVEGRGDTPCRFLINGQAVDRVSGCLSWRGANIMYHPVYWHFKPKTAKRIATMLGARIVWSK